MTRLIANIVGKNEADKYLPEVLSRLREQVDDIVFTDDASTDNTIGVVSEYTNHIQKLPESLFSTNEGKLRQKSWEFLVRETNPTPHDWILAIDCDELLYETNGPIRRIINSPKFDVVSIWFYHMWNETQFRTDKAWRPHPSTRLFRYQSNGVFKDVPLAPGSEPTYVPFIAHHYKHRYLVESGLRMKHLSYIKDEDKKEKFDRYMNIDGGKFHSNAHIISIMDNDPELMDWTWK